MFSTLRRLLSIFPSAQSRLQIRKPQRTTLGVSMLEDRLVPTGINFYWTGAGAAPGAPDPNDNWSYGMNWVGGVAPQPGQGDNLDFPTSPESKTANDDFPSGSAFSSITIEDNGYKLTGTNQVALQNGLTNTSGASTVQFPLALAAAQTFTDDSGASLQLFGSINNGGHLLSVVAGGTFIFNGSSISGAGGLNVSGGAKFYLEDTSPDTFTGITTVGMVTMYLDGTDGNAIVGNLSIGNSSGSNESNVLRLAASNQIASSSVVNIGWSGLLDLNGYKNTIGTLNMDGGNITTGTGLLTLAGNVTTQATNSTAIINGNLSLGSGNSPITFTIGSGTSNNDLNVLGCITGGAGVELIKAGAGQMQLGGADTYLGPTLVSAGVLVAANVDSLADSAGTTVSSGATLTYQGPSTASSESMAPEPVTVNGGTFQVNGNCPEIVVPGSLSLNGASTIEVGTGLTLDQIGTVNGSGSLSKGWAGILDLAVSNTYSGGTMVPGGILELGNSASLGSGAVKVGGTGSLELAAGLTVNNSLTLSSTGNTDAALYAAGDDDWIGAISLTGSSNIDVAASGVLTVGGVISGGAANSLTIGDATDSAAAGVVMLTNANTYAGATVVAAGTLAVANPTALGSPRGLTANAGTTVNSGATLELVGGLSFDPSEQLTLNGRGVGGEGALLNASGNNTWNGTIDLATTTSIGANAETTLTIDGIVSGLTTSNLAIVGNGTVVLAGTNTNFLGYAQVMSGTLSLDNAAALGGAPYNGGAGTTVEAGATLQLQGGLSYVIEPLILNGTGVGGVAGSLQIASGSDTWAGPIRLGSAATITADAGASFTDNIQIINEGYNLTVDAVGNITFGTTISGAGGLTKTGGGVLTFDTAAPNLYAGPTTINAGTLMLAKPAGIPAVEGAGLTIEPGATLAGSGLIDTNVTNSGTVSPGGTGSIGTLVVNGNFTQTASGGLDIELASVTSSDQLQVSGVINLGGTLSISLMDGYFPAPGTSFPILSFESSAGKFATTDLPSPNKGIELVPIFTVNNLAIDADVVS